MPIHIWTPGLNDDAGGIQAFSGLFVRSMMEAFPGRFIRVFVKNEINEEIQFPSSENLKIHTFGHLSPTLRTLALAAAGLHHAYNDQPACVLSTHLHFFPALKLLRTTLGTPYGGVLHGIEAWNIASRRRIKGLLGASRLIAVSRHTRDRVVNKYQLDPSRVAVVPNTYDNSRFRPGPKPQWLLEKHGLRADQPIILTVARMALSERYKGHWQMLTAMSFIRDVFPDAHYLIVGTGDEEPHLRSTAQSLGLTNNVTFAGFVHRDELPDYYRLCDVFAMPSTREGFGIVFIEAAASGKPVVAGNLDGSTDALDDGRLGILVDPYNPREIADAIIHALDKSHPNPLLFQPEALSQEVARHFGYERVSRLFASAVAELINAHQPADGAVPHPAPISAQPSNIVPAPRKEQAPHIAVLTQLTSPYQVEFFNRIAQCGACHLEVIYLTAKDPRRKWTAPEINHSHLILSKFPKLKDSAMDTLLSADVTIFNYYTHSFAWRALRQRHWTGKPWVFWGERPGFYLGTSGRWFRKMSLGPLYAPHIPIWGVGQFAIDGYRAEFGSSRSYTNVSYYSDLKRFENPQHARQNGRTILYSGTTTRRKGADLLASAFATVAAENKGARLLILGEGNLEPTMKRTLAPCLDQVEWTGFQPWEKLPHYYSKADIFCFPSRYDGWGLALVEALASGLPAIATRQTGAALDLIQDGSNGWLIESENQEALTSAMRAAMRLSDAELAAMQEAARTSVRHHALDDGARIFLEAAKEAIRKWPSDAAA